MSEKMTLEQIRLVEENSSLIYPIIKRYRACFPANCIYDFDDLVQISNMALIKAAIKYQEKEGKKFYSYACVAVKNALINAAKTEYRHATTITTDFTCDSGLLSSFDEEELFGDMKHRDLVSVLYKIRKDQSKTNQIGIDALIMTSLGVSAADFARTCGYGLHNLHTYMARARKIIVNDKRFIDYLEGTKQ